MNKKAPNKPKRYTNQNPLEAFKDFGTGVKNSVVDDVAKASMSDLWNQFFGEMSAGDGQNAKKASGDLSEGQELNLGKASKNKQEKAPKLDIEPGIDYRREILHSEQKVEQENTRELSVKIQEIIIELKQLMNASQELQVEFKEIAVEPRIVNPGKYHVSFFEWVLLLVKQARMKVEDSAAWMGAFKSKKAKKQYWNMFKKHGTTFGLSNERVVSTQTG